MPGQSTMVDVAKPGPRVAQGHILKAIAGGTALHGAPAELIEQFGVAGADLLLAILDLLADDRIALETEPDGRYLISSPPSGEAP